jgi:Cadherin domain
VPIVPAIRIQRTVQYSDGTLAITEPDTRSSVSTVRYTILSGNDDGYFNMDPLNGDLFLVRQVDREQLPGSAVGDRFVLTIQASSSTEISSASSSRARIFIDIEDINDNLPAFDTNEYTISIVENLPINFHVLQLSATDNDLVSI